MRKLITAAAMLAVLPLTAHAYIGPGAGAGTIAIVLGVLTSIVMAFVGILWFPIKRLLKRRKTSPQTAAQAGRQAEAAEPGGDAR